MEYKESCLTPEMQEKIDKAIALISTYNKEKVCYSGYYFEKDDVDDLEDTEICDNKTCYNSMLKDLQEDYPQSEITSVIFEHTNDETFISCNICGIKLGDTLNGIRQEFEHHEQHSITKKDITNSDNAFSIENMLRCFPTYEYKVGTYEKYQLSIGNKTPYALTMRNQESFYKRVVAYADLIVKLLS